MKIIPYRINLNSSVASFAILFLIMYIVMVSPGCKKEENDDTESKAKDTMRVSVRFPTLLEALTEKDLTIPIGQCVYQDADNNEDCILAFDRNNLYHLFSIKLTAGKTYRISFLADRALDFDLLLLNSENDTVCTGVHNMTPSSLQIIFVPTETGVFYLSSRYFYSISFKTIFCHLSVEEIRQQDLAIDGLTFNCYGDWFISDEGYLALAMHNSGITKWAKLSTGVDSCRFTFNVSQASGFYRNEVGFKCFASDDLVEIINMPVRGYSFYVKGPGDWIYNHNGWYDYGQIPHNLPMGISYWYNLGFETGNNKIAYLYNNEVMKTSSCDLTYNKLYLIVDDTEKDTVYFKDIFLLSGEN